jgi:alanine racemase
MRLLRALLSELDESSVNAYPIHLKIDTGMHRLGFNDNQLTELLSVLVANPSVRVTGVLSHLASADKPEHDGFTRTQIDRFTAACGRLEQGLGYSFTRHLCNTAGLLRFPDAHFDMVRLGIGLYGVPSCTEDTRAVLPAGTLKTRISQLRNVAAGDSVGYGLRGIADHDRTIATVPVGYADGYPRALSSGKGKAYLHGHEVAVTGSVCMDMTMFDVTGVECAEGDELELFGDRPTLHELAAAAGTIPYEVLAGISPRVFRVYRYE